MTGCLNYEIFNEQNKIIKTCDIDFKDYEDVTRILYVLRMFIKSYGLTDNYYRATYSITMTISSRDWTRETGIIYYDYKEDKVCHHIDDITIKTSKTWKQNELF